MRLRCLNFFWRVIEIEKSTEFVVVAVSYFLKRVRRFATGWLCGFGIFRSVPVGYSFVSLLEMVQYCTLYSSTTADCYCFSVAYVQWSFIFKILYLFFQILQYLLVHLSNSLPWPFVHWFRSACNCCKWASRRLCD